MSGVNCHAILSGPLQPGELQPAGQVWQRARLWAIPPASPLISHALPGTSSAAEALMVCDLTRPGLAFLFDHR